MDPKPLAAALMAATGIAAASTPAFCTVLPCQITVTGHAYTNGSVVNVNAGDKIVCGGMFTQPGTVIGPGPGPGPAAAFGVQASPGYTSIPFPTPGIPFTFDSTGGITVVTQSTPVPSAADTIATGVVTPTAKSLTPAASTTTVTYTTTYRWGIIGGKPIANYVTGTKGYVVPIPSTMNASGTTFYFTDSSINSGGNAEVRVECDISGSDGSSYSENGYLWFNVYKPGGSIPILSDPGVVTYTGGLGGETLALGDPAGKPGITMRAPGAAYIGGTWAWVQLLHTFTTKAGLTTVTTLQGDPTLDNGYPYGMGLTMVDTPQIGLGVDLGTALSLDFAGTDYLIWNSGAPGAIYVPICSMDWDGLAQIQNGTLYGRQPAAKNYQPNLTAEPTWDYTIKTAP